MLENIDAIVSKSINEAIIYLNDLGIKKVGTEAILLGLVNYDESVCNFTLKNQNIDANKIKEAIKNAYLIRIDNEKYTNEFHKVLEVASDFSQNDKSNIIYDEHLFYALLICEETVAYQIFTECGLTIDDAIEEINEFLDNNDENIYLENLTKKAKEGKLEPFIGRKNLVEKVIRILHKKQKNNCMLIGNAGVGKSALVEGVAKCLLEIDNTKVVYRLDIGGIVAGTKYRGDLEERLLEVIQFLKRPNTIIFIDEIHNIINNSNENNLDIANILKPVLARGEIKCIGATTIDEYYRIIATDKALMRRFDNIFISEPSLQETQQILYGIAPKYEAFHNVLYPLSLIDYLIEVAKLLPNRHYPDKAIDILDEAGLLAKINKHKVVETEDILQVVLEMNGLDDNPTTMIKRIEFYPELVPFYNQYFLALNVRSHILSVQIQSEQLSYLLTDLENVLNIKSEAVLEIDGTNLNEAHYSSTLIGAPSGYVGYENGGMITEHVLKYPINAIIIKNIQKMHPTIMSQIKKIIKEGTIVDGKGRKVLFTNTVFIIINDKDATTKTIGFITKNNEPDNLYDIILTPNDINYNKEIRELLKKYAMHNYKILFQNNKKIDYQGYLKIKQKLLEEVDLKKNTQYRLYFNNDNEVVILKK